MLNKKNCKNVWKGRKDYKCKICILSGDRCCKWMGLSWWKGFIVVVNWIFSCVFVYIVEFDILYEYLKK